MTLRRFIFFLAGSFFSVLASACSGEQMTIIKKGRPVARIVIENPSDPSARYYSFGRESR